MEKKLPHKHDKKTEKLVKIMPTLTEFYQISRSFACLSDHTRLKLFWILCHVEECVINLAELMEMSSPAISHHLRVLKDSGLVIAKRVGKEMYYKASEDKHARVLHLAIEKVEKITCPNRKVEDEE